MPRPPNASTEEILAQVIKLISEHDISGFSVDMIAQVTRVSKSTIYNRWPSKQDLIFAAIASMKMPEEVPDTGDVGDNLNILMSNMIDFLNDPEVGRVFSSFLNGALRDPRLGEYRRKLTPRATQPFETVIKRAVEQHQLCLKVPLHLAIDLLVSPFAYRKLATSGPLNKADGEMIVKFFVEANGPWDAAAIEHPCQSQVLPRKPGSTM